MSTIALAMARTVLSLRPPAQGGYFAAISFQSLKPLEKNRHERINKIGLERMRGCKQPQGRVVGKGDGRGRGGEQRGVGRAGGRRNMGGRKRSRTCDKIYCTIKDTTRRYAGSRVQLVVKVNNVGTWSFAAETNKMHVWCVHDCANVCMYV